MTILEAMEQRHSVRNYTDKPIGEVIKRELNQEIEACNREGNLKIQLITGDTDIFKGLLAHYGGFRGAANYIALAGPVSDDLEEKAGYYGERIVLKAQQLGLNTCWVGATYKKGKCRAAITENQKMVCIIAIGYGATQGKPHKSKPLEKLCKADAPMPDWFKTGMKAVLLSPTAMNQQKFFITLDGDNVTFETKKGPYSNVDLGIAKYHFQTASGYTPKEKFI